jgi:hypothetical protein
LCEPDHVAGAKIFCNASLRCRAANAYSSSPQLVVHFHGQDMNVRQIGGTRRQPRNTSARLIMSDYLPNTVQLPANFLARL